MKEKIILISDIKKIDKILKRHGKNGATEEKPLKPKLKLIFIYSKKNSGIGGYVYAYEVDDGYFKECILDDFSTGKKFDEKRAEKLIKKLIDYCKKKEMDIVAYAGKWYGKSEFEMYKKWGFEINKRQAIANYYT